MGWKVYLFKDINLNELANLKGVSSSIKKDLIRWVTLIDNESFVVVEKRNLSRAIAITEFNFNSKNLATWKLDPRVIRHKDTSQTSTLLSIRNTVNGVRSEDQMFDGSNRWKDYFVN